MPTHYETLGVNKDADADTLKKAYRKRARRVHPDKTKGATTKEFQDLQRAYAVLIDADTRQQYDKFGECAGSAQTLREQAEMMLSAAVAQCVAARDSRHEDIIDIVSSDTINRIDACYVAANKAKREADKYRDAAKRLLWRNNGKSKLVAALETCAEQYDNQEKTALFEASKCEEMLRVLKEHCYMVESVANPKYQDLGLSRWENR